MSFYQGIRAVFGWPVRKIFRIHVHGIENLPEEGPTILCANHTSMIDVVVLIAALHRPIRFMAKAELFRIPVLSWLIRKMGAFPVSRGRADTGAIKQSLAVLSEGGMLGIFPQGKRHIGVDPSTTKVMSGIGMFVCRSEANVAPVFIKTKNNRVRFFGRTDLCIGKPILNSEIDKGEGKHDDYMRISRTLFDAVCALSEEQ